MRKQDSESTNMVSLGEVNRLPCTYHYASSLGGVNSIWCVLYYHIYVHRSDNTI